MINPVVGSTRLPSSHASNSSAATPVAENVARALKILIFPSLRIDSVDKTINIVSDLCLWVSPTILADHPVSLVVMPGKVTLKMEIASSSRSHRTRKKRSPAFGRVKLKLPPSTGVVKKASFLRSMSFSVVASDGTQHVQRAVWSSAHSCNADNKKVLLTIPEINKSAESDPKASPADR